MIICVFRVIFHMMGAHYLEPTSILSFVLWTQTSFLFVIYMFGREYPRLYYGMYIIACISNAAVQSLMPIITHLIFG